MSVFIVGADNLGDIITNLKSIGCHSLTHLRGRKNIHSRYLKIPEGTDLVLVMTDYVDHNIVRVIRDKAKSLCIPVVFSKRSWVHLSHRLKMVKVLS